MDEPTAATPVCVAVLCAAWCRTCDAYAPVLEAVAAECGAAPRWIDIEDEADLVGDLDIETFPTVAVLDSNQLRFFGPLTPQPETLRRVLRAAMADARPARGLSAEIQEFARRLRVEVFA